MTEIINPYNYELAKTKDRIVVSAKTDAWLQRHSRQPRKADMVREYRSEVWRRDTDGNYQYEPPTVTYTGPARRIDTIATDLVQAQIRYAEIGQVHALRKEQYAEMRQGQLPSADTIYCYSNGI